MKIKNQNGQYWTGTCWGVEQAAEEYAQPEDCPDVLDYGGEAADRIDEDTIYQQRVAYYVDDECVASVCWDTPGEEVTR